MRKILYLHNPSLVRDVASWLRTLGARVGQNSLFKFLREEGYLFSSGDRYNLPTEEALRSGMFTVRKSVRTSDGVTPTEVTLITYAGQQFLKTKFLPNSF